MTYEELRNALKTLGLAERVTLRTVKQRYRELVKTHHPDVAGDTDSGKIKKVNAAYRLLINYIENYSFNFNKKEFYQQNPEERVRQQFKDDPLWG